MAKRRTTIETCDNPDCTSEYESSADEPAPGYHLKGTWVLAGGGPIPETYACSETCITPAVLHRIREGLNG